MAYGEKGRVFGSQGKQSGKTRSRTRPARAVVLTVPCPVTHENKVDLPCNSGFLFLIWFCFFWVFFPSSSFLSFILLLAVPVSKTTAEISKSYDLWLSIVGTNGKNL